MIATGSTRGYSERPEASFRRLPAVPGAARVGRPSAPEKRFAACQASSETARTHASHSAMLARPCDGSPSKSRGRTHLKPSPSSSQAAVSDISMATAGASAVPTGTESGGVAVSSWVAKRTSGCPSIHAIGPLLRTGTLPSTTSSTLAEPSTRMGGSVNHPQVTPFVVRRRRNLVAMVMPRPTPRPIPMLSAAVTCAEPIGDPIGIPFHAAGSFVRRLPTL